MLGCIAMAEQGIEGNIMISDERAPAPAPGYGGGVQTLHWIGAFVVIGAWGLGFSLDLFPRGPERSAAINVHSTLGLLVFSLAVLRILWRGATRDPAPDGPAWMVPLAHAGHVTLYALTLALPAVGLFGRWARSGTAILIGGVALPAPFALPDSPLWAQAHATLAYALAALVAVHVTAALIHHLVLRDGILRRMLPLLPR
jgi:cytochrome b561